MNAAIKIIDLCSGAGGWACAARGLPMEVVMAVDLWVPACRTYALNHPHVTVRQGDLRDQTIRDEVMERADLARRDGSPLVVVGGVPCEWLSNYRSLNKVTDDERARQRATLDSVLSLVESIKPDKWCLEDVVGLIPELPLMTPFQVVNAGMYSPQRRKRVFVGDFPAPPIPARLDPRTLAHVLRDGPYRIGRRTDGREARTNATFSSETMMAAHPDQKCPTICDLSSRRDAEMVIVDPLLPGGIRQMEWQEAATAQGFPRDYVFWGSPSDVSRMVARAIQIDLGREILKSICGSLIRRRACPCPLATQTPLTEGANNEHP